MAQGPLLVNLTFFAADNTAVRERRFARPLPSQPMFDISCRVSSRIPRLDDPDRYRPRTSVCVCIGIDVDVLRDS